MVTWSRLPLPVSRFPSLKLSNIDLIHVKRLEVDFRTFLCLVKFITTRKSYNVLPSPYSLTAVSTPRGFSSLVEFALRHLSLLPHYLYAGMVKKMSCINRNTKP